MKFAQYFLLTAAVVLIAFTQQSSADVELVLNGGFAKSKSSVSNAEKLSMDGYTTAEARIDTQPENAAQGLELSNAVAREEFINGQTLALLTLGEALSQLGESARQGLAEASQKIQVAGVEVLDKMWSVTNLTVAGIIDGGEAEKQQLKSTRLGLQVAYDGFNAAVKSALQQARDTALVPPIEIQDETENADAELKDSDALAAIADINKAAQASIARGADAKKVNKLSKLLTESVTDLAALFSKEKEYNAVILKLADKDSLKELTKISNEESHKIFANVILDLGQAGAGKSAISSIDQAKDAIKQVVQGLFDLSFEKGVAFDLSASAFEDGIPSLGEFLLSSAKQRSRKGEVASIKAIAQGAIKIFNV